MFSFEGDFKTRPKVSLGGASRKVKTRRARPGPARPVHSPRRAVLQGSRGARAGPGGRAGASAASRCAGPAPAGPPGRSSRRCGPSPAGGKDEVGAGQGAWSLRWDLLHLLLRKASLVPVQGHRTSWQPPPGPGPTCLSARPGSPGTAGGSSPLCISAARWLRPLGHGALSSALCPATLATSLLFQFSMICPEKSTVMSSVVSFLRKADSFLWWA